MLKLAQTLTRKRALQPLLNPTLHRFSSDPKENEQKGISIKDVIDRCKNFHK